jgi:hypothetical protein
MRFSANMTNDDQSVKPMEVKARPRNASAAPGLGSPSRADLRLSQQLAQLGADQRDPTLTVGSQYANKVVVKCQ